MTDITILTDSRYTEKSPADPYISNIFQEYEILKAVLQDRGYTVNRIAWDDPDYNWETSRCVVFRTVWDYFERFEEFMEWLNSIKEKTKVVNPVSLVHWNIDKHYLRDLEEKGVNIVPTVFVDTGDYKDLDQVCLDKEWQDVVIKPAISGAAFHTYKILANDRQENLSRFQSLVAERDMLVQEYVPSITTRGEASLMVFNGEYTHAILKKAKQGDFRVQDDFGGTVHPYEPTAAEIDFAVAAFRACPELPAYGRADIVWDASGNPMLSELEIFEPELWLRFEPKAAQPFADGIVRFLTNGS